MIKAGQAVAYQHQDDAPANATTDRLLWLSSLHHIAGQRADDQGNGPRQETKRTAVDAARIAVDPFIVEPIRESKMKSAGENSKHDSGATACCDDGHHPERSHSDMNQGLKEATLKSG